MKPFTLSEGVFSLKCYLSAMLALYVSYSIDLPRPFWSVLSAYIVVVPLAWAGAVRSKALFRLAGTILGSIATVFMVPQLSNYPVLMTGAMSLWVGGCLYLASVDRTPRAYVFMLAGYTAALIGFPSVSDPIGVFDTAVARVEEIGIGIICGSLVHSIVLPSGIQPVIMRQLGAALKTARAWIGDTLRQRPAAERAHERRMFAGDITSLRLLSAHVPYEASNIRWTTHPLGALQDNLVAVTPLVSAVGDRLAALQADGRPLPGGIAPLLDQVSTWIDATPDKVLTSGLPVRAAIQRRMREIGPRSGWHDMLLLSLLVRLRELVTLCERGRKLRQSIERGLEGRAVPHRSRKSRRSDLHLDHGIALLSAFAAVVAIALVCTFWIFTGWTSGSAAAMMAAVFMSFFATMDNPVPFIRQFLAYTLWSIPVSALYLLVILPSIHSFEMLALTIFPLAFLSGILLMRPAISLKAMAFLIGVLGTLALQDTHSADLVSFINGMLGQVAGISAAALVSGIIRNIGLESSIARIRRANLRDLADLARQPAFARSRRFDIRMLDRVGLLETRLAALPAQTKEPAGDALLQLRIGSDIAALQNARRNSPAASAILQPVLDEIATHFSRRAADAHCAADPKFAGTIDHALGQVIAEPSARRNRTQIIVALVGIRRGVFPEAAGYLAQGKRRRRRPARSLGRLEFRAATRGARRRPA
jgi:uncharacterized membrane protein YccC